MTERFTFFMWDNDDLDDDIQAVAEEMAYEPARLCLHCMQYELTPRQKDLCAWCQDFKRRHKGKLPGPEEITTHYERLYRGAGKADPYEDDLVDQGGLDPWNEERDDD